MCVRPGIWPSERPFRKLYIKKESLEWYEYQSRIDEADKEIVNTRIDLIKLQDAINDIRMTNLGWQLDELTRSAEQMSNLMSLHEVQEFKEEASAYADLINNGMLQIEILEEENKQLREQQKGLYVLSEKYQEIQATIQSNNNAIMDMKVSQEQWNDSIVDLKINSLEKLRDTLQRTNDQYQRQKELQEAIEELERARYQRTQRVFVDGVGFTYQADQDAIKDAQDNLEDIITNQLFDKMDDLIDALEEAKGDTNIYDANGNLLGTQYTVPQLDNLNDLLAGYYNTQSIDPSMNDIKRSIYEQIASGATNNSNMTINIGDINLSEVDDAESLAQAIIDQFPNALLQVLYKKT